MFTRHWKFSLALLFTVLIPVLNASASDYPIEPMNQLCAEADIPEEYDTSILKSLKFLVQGENGWIYRSDVDFMTDFKEDGDYTDLQSFVDQLASQGTHLLIVYMPTRGLIHHHGIPASRFDFDTALQSYKKKVQKLKDLGIIVPDLSPLIGIPDAGSCFFKRDIHWTPEGARRTAQIVAAAIQKTGLIDEQKTFTVSNEQAGQVTINGSLGKGVKLLCGDQFINEYVTGYTTSSSFAGSGNDLFANEPETEMILLGTSFSALPKFNFNGFLQADLKAPITNYAISGGGEKGAWLKYMSQDDYLESPPKIVIWEIQGNYTLDGSTLFAQLKPLMSPALKKKNLLISNSVALGKTQALHNTLFFSDRMLHILPSKLAFDVQFSDPEINNIRFRVWYKDGKNLEKGLKIPSRAKMGGHFIFSLFGSLRDQESDLVAMELLKVENKPVEKYLTTAANDTLGVNVKVYRMGN